MSVPKILLNNSRSFPALGLGTWKADPGLVKQAVKDAISIGYRHFDCAYVYQNEDEIGKAITECIDSSKVARKDLFITSKLWSTYHSAPLVKQCLKESLEKLNLSYLDLYLMHWPWGLQEGGELFPLDENGKRIYSDVDYVESWKAMEECYKEGLVKAIGFSNFNHKQIDRIFENCSVAPSVLQVECHPYFNQAKLIEYCKKKDIVFTSYSPLGSPGRPWAADGEPILMEDPKVVAIAEKYKKTPAQVLIRFQLQRGIAVIPKSTTKSRIQENFKVFDFEISQEEMDELFSLNRNKRYFELKAVFDHQYYPFHEEY